jgi:chemotaxis response regulator CheB
LLKNDAGEAIEYENKIYLRFVRRLLMKKKAQKDKKETSSRKAASKDRKKVQRLTSFPVVAIGASAGGVEASRQLLKHISTDLGMAQGPWNGLCLCSSPFSVS